MHGQLRVRATADGRAFSFGVGDDETLGLGLTEDQPMPMEYPGLKVKAAQMP